MGGRTRRQLTRKVVQCMACSSIPRKRTCRGAPHERAPYRIPTGSPVEQAAMASALSKEGLSGSLSK